MATIRKIEGKRGVSYRAEVRIEGFRKSRSFKTLKAAKHWARTLEGNHEARKALMAEAASPTFAEVAKLYIEQWSGRDKSRPAAVEWWVRRLGKYKLTHITPELICQHLDEYAEGKAERWNGVGPDGKHKTCKLSKPRSPATVNRRRAALAAVFKFATRDLRGSGLHARDNPMPDVPTRKGEVKRQRYLSEDERLRLLEACRRSEWEKLELLVILAITTGARLGELLGLHWSDIDFSRREAKLERTKNGEPRILPLPEPAIKALLPFREVGKGLVFPSERRPWRPFEFRKHWNRALREAGIQNFRFHDLRHSCASFLFNKGHSLDEIGRVLGHKTAQTTLRYSHLDVERKREITEDTFSNMRW